MKAGSLRGLVASGRLKPAGHPHGTDPETWFLSVEVALLGGAPHAAGALVVGEAPGEVEALAPESGTGTRDGTNSRFDDLEVVVRPANGRRDSTEIVAQAFTEGAARDASWRHGPVRFLPAHPDAGAPIVRDGPAGMTRIRRLLDDLVAMTNPAERETTFVIEGVVGERSTRCWILEGEDGGPKRRTDPAHAWGTPRGHGCELTMAHAVAAMAHVVAWNGLHVAEAPDRRNRILQIWTRKAAEVDSATLRTLRPAGPAKAARTRVRDHLAATGAPAGLVAAFTAPGERTWTPDPWKTVGPRRLEADRTTRRKGLAALAETSLKRLARIRAEAEARPTEARVGGPFDVATAASRAISLTWDALRQVEDTGVADAIDDDVLWDRDAMEADYAERPSVVVAAFVNARHNLQIVLRPGPDASAHPMRRNHWKAFPRNDAAGWGRPASEVLWLRDLEDLVREPYGDPEGDRAVIARQGLRDDTIERMAEVRAIAGGIVAKASEEVLHRLSSRFPTIVDGNVTFSRRIDRHGRAAVATLRCVDDRELRAVAEARAVDEARRIEREAEAAALRERAAATAAARRRVAAVAGDPRRAIARAREIAAEPRSGRLVKEYLDSVGIPTSRGRHGAAIEGMEADLALLGGDGGAAEPPG